MALFAGYATARDANYFGPVAVPLPTGDRSQPGDYVPGVRYLKNEKESGPS